jgi:hypothetical protein
MPLLACGFRADFSRGLLFAPLRAAKVRTFFRSLLPVLREKARMRVISSTSGVRSSKSPLPSPGVPGEGEKSSPGLSRAKRSASNGVCRGECAQRPDVHAGTLPLGSRPSGDANRSENGNVGVRLRRRIAVFVVVAALAALTFAQRASAAPTQEEVFKSIQDNVGSPTDSRKFLLYVCVSGGVFILLALFSQRRQRQVIPRALNNHGKLLKEIMKGVPVRPREIKQLKTLTDQTQVPGGTTVQDPLTLLLCPSVLARAVQNPRCKADRRVLQQVLRKVLMTTPAVPNAAAIPKRPQPRASNEKARRASPSGRAVNRPR